MSRQRDDEQQKRTELRLSLLSFLKTALLVFGLALGGIAIAALFAAEDTQLSYEGFD